MTILPFKISYLTSSNKVVFILINLNNADIEPDKFLRVFWSALGLKIFKKYKIEHIFFWRLTTLRKKEKFDFLESIAGNYISNRRLCPTECG